MQARVFTETWLRSLLKKKPPPKRDDTREIGRKGFTLRWWPGGALTFVLRYMFNGKPDVLTLGSYPAMSLEEAHEAHSEARKQLDRGLDPKAEREAAARAEQAQAQRARVKNAVTVRNVIAEWAWHFARRERKRPREAVRLLKVHLLKPLAGKPAHEIAKRDLVLVIDRILARGSKVMANRMRDLIVQVFEFAAQRDLIPTSPASGLLRKPGGKEESSDRWLTTDEIRTFWRALDAPDTAISLQVRLGLRLILVTAQRPGEVAQAQFSQFDIEGRCWTIPASIAKNGREHLVPLTDLAVELIEQLRTLAKDRPYLLPSHQSKLKRNEPISERALSRALRNNHEDGRLFGIEPFTPHDLRRTASTHMTSLGISRFHVGKVLNHSDKEDTTGIYDRYGYWDEKKEALTTWEAELRSVIEGKERKVVPMRQRRGGATSAGKRT